MHYPREPRAIFDTIGAQSPTERGAFLPTGRVNDIGCEAAVPPLECLASWSRIPGWRDTQDLRINWTDQQSGAYTHQGAPPAGQGQVPGTPGLLKGHSRSQTYPYRSLIAKT